MKTIILTLVASFGLTSFVQFEHTHQNCFPESDIKYPVTKSKKSISEASFIKQAVVFKDLMEEDLPAQTELRVNAEWDEEKANAVAFRTRGTAVIEIWGGLARHPFMTQDAIYMVSCHELGHHIGGSPKKLNIKERFFHFEVTKSWATNEGQADYFGALKCFRRLLKRAKADGIKLKEPKKERFTKSQYEITSSLCKKQFDEDFDVEICQRGALAGLAVSQMFESFRTGIEDYKKSKIDFSKPDSSKTKYINHRHPGLQCRADTYLSGSLCEADEDTDLATADYKKGTCTRAAGDKVGMRPLCWFNPKDAQLKDPDFSRRIPKRNWF